MSNAARIPALDALNVIPKLSVGTSAFLNIANNSCVVTMHTPDGEVWADGSVHDTFDHFPVGPDAKVSLSAILKALGY